MPENLTSIKDKLRNYNPFGREDLRDDRGKTVSVVYIPVPEFLLLF